MQLLAARSRRSLQCMCCGDVTESRDSGSFINRPVWPNEVSLGCLFSFFFLSAASAAMAHWAKHRTQEPFSRNAAVVLAWAGRKQVKYNPAWNFKANAHPRRSRLDARRPKGFEREVSNLFWCELYSTFLLVSRMRFRLRFVSDSFPVSPCLTKSLPSPFYIHRQAKV